MIVEAWRDFPCGCSQSTIEKTLGTVPRHYIISGACKRHIQKLPIPLWTDRASQRRVQYGPFEGVLR